MGIFGAGNAGAARRTGKPDWDDSAKLEALRSKSPQKQRQKVHIIGENDDALTTETSGFAGEKQAVVLSASLARPAKQKASQKVAAKPMAALRKRKKETTRQRQRRRAMELRAAREAKQVRPEMIVVPEANLTVQELADMLSIESSEIIKSLFFKGTPIEMGFAERRLSVPPCGAINIPNPDVLTNKIDTQLFLAVNSAQAPTPPKHTQHITKILPKHN